MFSENMIIKSAVCNKTNIFANHTPYLREQVKDLLRKSNKK